MKVRDGKKLTSILNKKHLQSVLNKLEMSDCQGSVSPMLDKSCISGDNEELSEEQARGSDLQYSLCCISATKERTSKVQFDCCVRS